ncbi:hypothetical protein AB0E04_39390 [Streptomyces sp. NPDC048251]|uniref:Integral membrane protein n=1 Tax=Streptomyces rishiriensis TaxID=68264 RepID=A0ABU0NGI9_STRRH|nr:MULTISPECIES: hypothetical protein [Streptomyces]MDQ0578201.1 hypothetical protein [Streptomyces rishiriensis]MDR6981218.1 hypothetical protein [Streptomyces sp. 3330]
MSNPTAAHDVLAAAFDPGADADFLLGLLAWCASAAGVAGVIFTGTVMALQLRRGEPGEGASHMRGLFYVFAGSVLAATAGPIIQFLGPLGL